MDYSEALPPLILENADLKTHKTSRLCCLVDEVVFFYLAKADLSQSEERDEGPSGHQKLASVLLRCIKLTSPNIHPSVKQACVIEYCIQLPHRLEGFTWLDF